MYVDNTVAAVLIWKRFKRRGGVEVRYFTSNTARNRDVISSLLAHCYFVGIVPYFALPRLALSNGPTSQIRPAR